MERHENPNASTAPSLVGVLLIVAGGLFLAIRISNIDVSQYGWPLFVILAGVALVLLGIISRPLAGLVVPGSIVTMVGAILAVQNSFGLWASWSYAWTLIAPTSIGVGTVILGLTHGDRQQVSDGTQAVLVGLGLFAAFGVFFEGILHVDGTAAGPITDVALPVLLIAAGIVLVAWRLYRGWRPK